jgi:protein-L-isoaspartate(D-aspartate) O-methyltransferase
MNYEQARFNMIEQQIRPWEVLDSQVLALLAVIKREDFVPTAYRSLAFADMEIPLSSHSKTQPGQCMLSPKVEARILQDLAVQKYEKVLEIGTGSGYMAALLGRRAAHVLTLEIEPELALQARKNLATQSLSNVEVRLADGANGAAAEGPFDVIVLSGSVAEVPQALLAQLKVGGRLAAIVGEEPMMRATFITRNSDSAWTTAEPWDTVAPRLVHFAEHSHFRF